MSSLPQWPQNPQTGIWYQMVQAGPIILYLSNVSQGKTFVINAFSGNWTNQTSTAGDDLPLVGFQPSATNLMNMGGSTRTLTIPFTLNDRAGTDLSLGTDGIGPFQVQYDATGAVNNTQGIVQYLYPDQLVYLELWFATASLTDYYALDVVDALTGVQYESFAGYLQDLVVNFNVGSNTADATITFEQGWVIGSIEPFPNLSNV